MLIHRSSCIRQQPVDHGILKSLHEVSGVYVDENKRKGFEKTVVITTCNHGFLNHLYNFKCFADRLQIRFLVLAMDLKLQTYLTEHTNMVSYLLRAGSVGNVSSSSSEWLSFEYNAIVNKKTEAVYTVLSHGYDLLFADVDIAIVSDPFPYFNMPGMHYMHSSNSPCTR